MKYTPRLKTKYHEEVVPALMKEFNYRNQMQVPRLKKISVNQGLGIAIADKKIIDTGIEEMSLITGQRAVATKSRKDISNFKLRRGMPIGVRVTLRGDRMYEFLDRLISVAIPRVRDFRGISDKGFDDVEITHSVYQSRSSSPRSISIRSARSMEWTSLL